jgi:hypothetical protein
MLKYSLLVTLFFLKTILKTDAAHCATIPETSTKIIFSTTNFVTSTPYFLSTTHHFWFTTTLRSTYSTTPRSTIKIVTTTIEPSSLTFCVLDNTIGISNSTNNYPSSSSSQESSYGCGIHCLSLYPSCTVFIYSAQYKNCVTFNKIKWRNLIFRSDTRYSIGRTSKIFNDPCNPTRITTTKSITSTSQTLVTIEYSQKTTFPLKSLSCSINYNSSIIYSSYTNPTETKIVSDITSCCDECKLQYPNCLVFVYKYQSEECFMYNNIKWSNLTLVENYDYSIGRIA